MAIYHPDSQIVDSREFALASGAQVAYDGQVMVRSTSNAAAGVLPSTGVAGELFVGFANLQTTSSPVQEAFAVKVETYTVPATQQITLTSTPTALSQVSVSDQTTGSIVAPAGLTLTGAVLGGAGLVAGNTVRVTYRYNLTVNQARSLYGNVNPAGYGGNQINTCGVATRGLIYTNMFDAGVDWNANGTTLKAAAGGIVTASGSGAAINGYVTSTPSTDKPFLGIEFSVA